jgi:arylsulfatase A-like enzyme
MRRLLALSCCLALAACGRSEFAGSNVLVIGIDTLRADHLGCYGYPRPTSPHIDTLAVEGVVFTDTIAQSPWTLPSFASIFTGLLPSAHRAGEGSGWTRSRLGADVPTLATEVHRAGWRTGSFVSNGFAGEAVGLGEGFETKYQWIDSAAALNMSVQFLRKHARERFFAFVHLVDPHHPYTPPPEDAAPFLDPSYQGRIGNRYTAWPPPPGMTPADHQRVIDLYDGDVHVSDRRVGQLVAELRTLGVLERTIVVVIADHGEELFDHRFNGHGHTLYDELLKVPFVIRFPRARWVKRIDTQVQAMDLFPTVLDALGLPIPPNLQGVSRMPLVRGTAPPPPPDAQLAVSEYLFFAPEQKAVRRRDLKLISIPSTAKERAFDLVADPKEQTDVAAKRAGDLTALRVVLERELLTRIEGFQIAARSARLEHRVRIEIESPKPFADAGVIASEKGETFSRSADGRKVEVNFVLPPSPSTGVQFGDEDILRFRTHGDVPFTVTAEVDGQPFPAANVYLGAKRTPIRSPTPWTFTGTEESLVAPFPPGVPPSTGSDARLGIYRVRRPEMPIATLDEKTRESLRQLGYVE